MAAILDFQNGDYFFLKSGDISASNHTRHMILVSKHTFRGQGTQWDNLNVIQYIQDTVTEE